MGPPRTYRIRLWLRVACALAAILWATVFAAALRSPFLGWATAAGAGVFTAFFALSTLLYTRTWIAVGPRGIVASSPLRRRPVPFEDILQVVVVRDGVGGRVYAVVTRRGLVHFTSLLARHRELFEMLLARASLAPLEA